MEESKVYQWRYVTASGRISQGVCELVHAELVPTSNSNGTILYDGVDSTGTVIQNLNAQTQTNRCFKPAKPVYCQHGLYITIGSHVNGVFVQWRELGKEG